MEEKSLGLICLAGRPKFGPENILGEDLVLVIDRK